MDNIESTRIKLQEWKHWGPYLSERQWGTVREDYSEYGSAWDFFPHDHARSRAYRWGEDGIAGISDHKQHICFAPAFWNKKDAILKERLFGLTGKEGNHSEDVKELYYYLDSSPSHSYMKYLYKYAQSAYPYEKLVSENALRNKEKSEYEIYDTGIFDQNEYFDIYIEYYKKSAFEILIEISIHNKSEKEAEILVLPTVWFRNTWSWNKSEPKPNLKLLEGQIILNHPIEGSYTFLSESKLESLFTDNETNATRLFGLPSSSNYVKDAFHEYFIQKRKNAVNDKKYGTKACFYKDLTIEGQGSTTLRFALVKTNKEDVIINPKQYFKDFDQITSQRKTECNQFYEQLQAIITDDNFKRVQREAWAGLLWGKQYYYYDVRRWLEGDPDQYPPPETRKTGRNSRWKHIRNNDIISMPDKWEYPWYAAWDLAFHCIPFAYIDPYFAKQQLELFLSNHYLNDFGQLPAYEWAFGDVNPPVHALGVIKVYEIEKNVYGKEDKAFLKKCFIPLLKNFNWWLNTKAINERLIFGGGFLGLDNVGALDRGAPLPNGAWLEQVDGTCWMALFSLSMMEIALELAQEDPIYEAEAAYFARIFLRICRDINHPITGLWNNDLSLYNDIIVEANGNTYPIEVRNIVDVMSIYPVSFIKKDKYINLTKFKNEIKLAIEENQDWKPYLTFNQTGDMFFSLLDMHKFEAVVKVVFDEDKFLSPYGVRSLSREYKSKPYIFNYNNLEYKLNYKANESDTYTFGENSNWRGPIWFPVNYVLIEALKKYAKQYGEKIKFNYPSNTKNTRDLKFIYKDLSMRLSRLFIKDILGNYPIYKNAENLLKNKDLSNLILFYEYFDGDNGSGCGASHQTGWTALVADLIFNLDFK